MKKGFVVLSLIFLTLGGGIVWIVMANAPQSRRNHTDAPKNGGLEMPSFHSEQGVARAETVLPKPTPVPTPLEMPVIRAPERKAAPMRIYTNPNPPSPPPAPEEDRGHYAPSFRMVRCKLVNTIDSSSIETPIIGLVTDDVMWNGHVIIPKCSEVHGIAQIDKARERVASGGAWTFILHDESNPGLGRELVVKGLGLDREDDPEFKKLMVGNVAVDNVQKTWGITDGSAGIRGVVIKTNDSQVLQLFVATFLSGVAQSVQGYQNGLFGNYASPNSSGAGGVSGAIINPPMQGAGAVLDRYAQMVMDSIERDGFFIRVPAGKLFYVYVTEDILTGRATVGGAQRLHAVEQQYLEDRSLQEKVTEPRDRRDQKRENPNIGNPLLGSPVDQESERNLDRANDALRKRSEELQKQAEQLEGPSAQPNVTP